MDKPLILQPGQVWQRNQEKQMQIVSIKEDIVYLLPADLSSPTYIVSTIQALLTERRWNFIK